MGTLSLAERAGICALFLFLTTPALAQSATATRLVTASPSPVGQPVTMTAEVDAFAGSAPRGSVSFADGATNLGSALLDPLGAGQATLATGAGHSCALTSNGGVKCWGWNNHGQLGDGTTTDRATPVWVAGLTSGVVAVSVGLIHSCALTNLGAVKCWGFNYGGQLGDGTRETRRMPTPVTGLASGVVAIGSGNDHNCAVTVEGRVMCWGQNPAGQLGDGSYAERRTPVLVDDPGIVYTAVEGGGQHTCGVTSAGAARCWGANGNGQIGDSAMVWSRSRPVPVFGLSQGVAAVTAGGWHSCAVTIAGAVKCWGFNGDGEVGDGNAYDRRIPAQVVGMESGVVAISVGAFHSCGLLSSGAVRCWGLNSNGQLGEGSLTKRYTPVPVSSLGGAAASLATGSGQSCAVLSPTRILRCWGRNDHGQIGDGTTAPRLLPRSVASFWGLLRGRARLARTLAAGVHPLQATYSGDASHAPSTSPVVQHRGQ